MAERIECGEIVLQLPGTGHGAAQCLHRGRASIRQALGLPQQIEREGLKEGCAVAKMRERSLRER